MKRPVLSEPLALGTLVLPNRLLLAPLAGVSDPPFRRICQELGAGLTYIEMLSAAGMPYRTRKTEELIVRDPNEPILGAQITGPTPEVTARGVELLMEYALPFDTLDLNMGCPVKKIVGKGCGSALMKDAANAAAIVRAVKSVCGEVPVTAKIRLGFQRGERVVAPFCQALTEAGAVMLTIHGRTRDDDYSDPVQYDGIAKGFEAARRAGGDSAPILVGNGNIFDPASARRMVEETGCDAVMVSRGALGNPWIFRQILRDDPAHPRVDEWYQVVMRHVAYHAAFYGEEHYAAIRFRKHLLWYVSGFPNARKMRAELSVVNSMAEVREKLAGFVAHLPPEFERYDSARLSGWSADQDPKFDMDREHDRGVEVE